MHHAEVRARELIARLPVGAREGVEVGVWKGEMSRKLLELHPGLLLHMVDNWLPASQRPASYRRSGDVRARDGIEVMCAAKAEAIRVTDFARARRRLHPVDSLTAAKMFARASLDFVFIDAEHSYEAVRADIEAWLPAIRPGGVISGHDYSPPGLRSRRGWPGVVRAIDEAAARHEWSLDLGREATWFATVS